MSFVLNCGLYLKTGKWVLSRKRDNVSNLRYVRKCFKFTICSKIETLALS